jgi:hypothetical protein
VIKDAAQIPDMTRVAEAVREAARVKLEKPKRRGLSADLRRAAEVKPDHLAEFTERFVS